MGFFARFRRKVKEETASTLGFTGQPVEVITDLGPTPHPDHYDRERNAARIQQLTLAIAQFNEQGGHEKTVELQAELDKQLKIKELFYEGEEV